MIQSILNNQVLEMLPIIKPLIENASNFERNQIINYTLRECNNSKIAIIDMSESQLNAFQANLITIFKYKKLI